MKAAVVQAELWKRLVLYLRPTSLSSRGLIELKELSGPNFSFQNHVLNLTIGNLINFVQTKGDPKFKAMVEFVLEQERALIDRKLIF
jgi:hypothetical protein